VKSADLLYEQLCAELLGEAPISDVSVSSKEYPEIPINQATGNTKIDIRLMGNPKYLERLSQETARNIPFNIKLILVDSSPGALFDLIASTHYYRIHSSNIAELARFAWQPTKDTITLILGPTGEPMKLSANKKGAWLVGHKLGHALFDNINIRGNKEMEANAEIYNQLETEIINYFIKFCTTLSPEEKRYPKDMRFKMFTKSKTRIDSSQQQTIINHEEFLFELVGQYVMFGKVTFHHNSAYANQAFESQDEANTAADKITKMIIAGLRNAVGKTIVDVG